MDRFAIFVDAGYLYAEGGKLARDTSDRLRLRLDFKEAVSFLSDKGETTQASTISELIGTTRLQTPTRTRVTLRSRPSRA